ncbi:MAG: type II toxin-antitoxin system Phd/YefM family antitoxin [Mycobacteriales bacterium]
MKTVGVRELRQNASELLAELATTGESILITNHGRLVARLVPAESPSRASRDQLLAAGTLRPGRGDPLGVSAVTSPVATPATGDLLAADREDR